MKRPSFAKVQQLGRALMLPIAVLPIAGLLLRIGQPDLLDVKVIAQAGDAIFSQLPLLFAIGVGVGFAQENAGVAGLAGALGYFVLRDVAKAIHADNDLGVLGGILAGLLAAGLYNRFKDIRLPEYLAFFGGRRFVPIATGIASLAVGAALGFAWPPVHRSIDALGGWLLGAGALGVFVYGALNRLLLVTGLHHILNSLVWFVFGNYTDAAGKPVHGDIHRFFAGDPTAGAFMTGFFPIMMFGLPAACLAMYRAAPPENRRGVGGMLLSMALTSFLTGVTEPIEFSFMFLAPELYAVHALLTGLSLAVMNALGVRLGFTFSAGAFDYALSYGLSSRGWMLLPVGALTFALYYGVFLFCIRRFRLATPGREAPAARGAAAASLEPAPAVASDADRAQAFVSALGGRRNLMSVDACTTRLRLQVADNTAIDEPALKALGAKAVVRPAPGSLQVVLGPEADRVAASIRELVGKLTISTPPAADVHSWLEALGGEQNVLAVEPIAGTRLRIELVDASRLDEPRLKRLGAPAVMRLSPSLVHVVVAPELTLLAANLVPSRREQAERGNMARAKPGESGGSA
jgi:PTS system N-acetylglucosamine-specific IIC component